MPEKKFLKWYGKLPVVVQWALIVPVGIGSFCVGVVQGVTESYKAYKESGNDIEAIKQYLEDVKAGKR